MKRWKGSACIGGDDFFGDDLEAFADDGFGLGEGDAEALVGVGPGFGEAEEEVVAGDDEDFAAFEALVEFGGCDGAVFEPEPEEEGAFAGVEGVGDAVAESFAEEAVCELAFGLVEGADDFAGGAGELVALQERLEEGLADVAVGEGEHGVHVGESGGDAFVGDDDGGADAGEAEFGEADGDDEVLVPDGCPVGVDGAGEGHAVGLIENEGDAVGGGDFPKGGEFGGGDDVTRWVGGAGEAEGGDVGGEGGAEAVEVDAVLEGVVGEFFDGARDGDEGVGVEGLVGVADVFGGDGEEDFLFAVVTGEEGEEVKEGGLTAGHDDDVFFGAGPAAFALEEGGHGAAEGGAAAGGVVIDEGAIEAVGFVFEEVTPLIPPEGLHFGDGGGVAAAEHAHVRFRGHGATEVFHQFLDAAGASQFFTQGGKRDHSLPSCTSPTQARKSKSSATSSICQRPSALRRKEPTHFWCHWAGPIMLSW